MADEKKKPEEETPQDEKKSDAPPEEKKGEPARKKSLRIRLPTISRQKKTARRVFIISDKNVSVFGGNEAEQNNLTELENTIKLNELPLMYSLGEDKLTEIFLIGKRTLRFICSESE